MVADRERTKENRTNRNEKSTSASSNQDVHDDEDRQDDGKTITAMLHSYEHKQQDNEERHQRKGKLGCKNYRLHTKVERGEPLEEEEREDPEDDHVGQTGDERLGNQGETGDDISEDQTDKHAQEGGDRAERLLQQGVAKSGLRVHSSANGLRAKDKKHQAIND